jgi:hypothetical protein
MEMGVGGGINSFNPFNLVHFRKPGILFEDLLEAGDQLG